MAKTFLLVHGAFVGEWCFDPILPLLMAQGVHALTVSLTGYGKKKDLYRSNLSMTDHIQDVVDFVEKEQLTEIVLVGHSYGGAVITGAWDRLRDRVCEAIYIDANTPNDGESLFDCMQRFDQTATATLAFLKAAEAGISEIDFPIRALEKRDPARAAEIKDKLMPLPLSCIVTPIDFKYGPLPQDVPKTFIFCSNNRSYHQNQAKEMRNDPSWRYFELATGHDAMLEDPVGLVKILLDNV